ncbi:MAG: hypothetical protein U5L96_08225 [Owenweeksia sp.]|nr:hypothetical protein [Owenweeksia sp.]
MSPWIGPFSFQVPCNIFTTPFAESFESSSNSAGCWSNQYVTASSDWVINTGSGTGGSITSAQSGTNNLWYQTNGSHITKYVSPRIDISRCY